MAAVSFLETTNLVGLGLSADKVFSHVTDLNAEHKVVEPSINKSISTKTNQPQTNNPGLKMVSDVFDGLGKFWQRNTQDLENNRTSSFNPTDGPIVKFLEMKSVDELKIGEVTELLADYKRLAAIIKQAGLA
ncbi:MAG: hypothetical protein EXX96DRAFT_474563 [Benjaminiella poitrasii]|nr:MAG: hypothetical protein EXX96DRAFT_474563 [Benjaminiella poitrasii]